MITQRTRRWDDSFIKKLSVIFLFLFILFGAASFAYASSDPESGNAAPVYLSSTESTAVDAVKKDRKSTVNMLGREFYSDSKELDLTDITSKDIPELLEKLSVFPELHHIILPDTISVEEFCLLSDCFPDVLFDYHFELYHQPISVCETTELMFRRLPKVDDEAIDNIALILPYLPELETVSFNRCPASYEKLDELRKNFPEINVRFVVQFAAFSAWSDTEKIWAMAGLYHDEDAENLKYFHNLRYLDIGHNGLTKCEFLYEMPEIEVLIIAIGELEDIAPIASLKKLEYLEICDTKVEDLSPLSECTTLEHLNLGGIPADDLSPLYSLTGLKRLFADNMVNISEADRIEYENEFRRRLPDAEISFLMGPEGGVENGYWRYSRGPYTGSFVERYALLREQFGYTDDSNQAYVYD